MFDVKPGQKVTATVKMRGKGHGYIRIYFNDAVVKGADELKRRLSESLSAREFRPDKERIIVRSDVNAPLSTVAEVLTVAEELNVSVLFMSGGQPKSRTASFTEPES